MINQEFSPGKPVQVKAGNVTLEGYLSLAKQAPGIVLFAHGSGSSRHSPRNQFVARFLQEGGLGTLLIDLLTAEEEEIDLQTRELRFNISFLAERLMAVTEWLREEPETRSLPIGYFGSSTGAAAALIAAAKVGSPIGGVVSRGGRPDLAAEALTQVRSPTLLIVGGADSVVLELNREALAVLPCEKNIEIVPHATHLFEEPGALEEVARLAREWFLAHFVAPR